MTVWATVLVSMVLARATEAGEALIVPSRCVRTNAHPTDGVTVESVCVTKRGWVRTALLPAARTTATTSVSVTTLSASAQPCTVGKPVNWPCAQKIALVTANATQLWANVCATQASLVLPVREWCVPMTAPETASVIPPQRHVSVTPLTPELIALSRAARTNAPRTVNASTDPAGAVLTFQETIAAFPTVPTTAQATDCVDSRVPTRTNNAKQSVCVRMDGLGKTAVCPRVDPSALTVVWCVRRESVCSWNLSSEKITDTEIAALAMGCA